MVGGLGVLVGSGPGGGGGTFTERHSVSLKRYFKKLFRLQAKLDISSLHIVKFHFNSYHQVSYTIFKIICVFM